VTGAEEAAVAGRVAGAERVAVAAPVALRRRASAAAMPDRVSPGRTVQVAVCHATRSRARPWVTRAGLAATESLARMGGIPLLAVLMLDLTIDNLTESRASAAEARSRQATRRSVPGRRAGVTASCGIQKAPIGA
jgi:hypothetical protein